MAEAKWLDGVGGRSLDQLIQLAATHRIDSIVIAIEDALLEKAEVSATEQVVLAVESMEREVNNGGFEQFFCNASVAYAPVLVSALEQIGAPKTAEIADRAASVLGAESDWPSERYEVAVSKVDESTQAELSACDNAYHSSGEALADLLFEFIKANKADIELSADSA
jgi:hypothetical protein